MPRGAAARPRAAGAARDRPLNGDGAELAGRLNLFQRMMLRWRELHPYNPVHVVLIPAPLAARPLAECIDRRLEASA